MYKSFFYYFLRVAIMTLILSGIVIFVYMKRFAKSDILFISFAISSIGILVYDFLTVYFTPIEKVSAIVKSKEMVTSVSNNNAGIRSYASYCIIFQIEDGEEKSLTVPPQDYATIFEGNKGILSFKESNHFCIYNGFEIEEI